MAALQPLSRRWARLRAWVLQTSHLVLVIGGLSALAALVGVGALAVNDFRTVRISHQNHAAMLARVLEDQATRTMQTAELALESLATSPALTGVASEPRRMQDALGQALAALSFLRGLAVVDPGGRVIASTTPGDAESFVDLSKLGPPVEVGRTVQGGLIPGRSLQSVRLGAAAQTVPVGVAFIPVLYGYQNEARQKLVLVALLNPDSLSNFQHLTLESEIFDSVVTSYDGQVLATSGAASALAGTRVNHIPVFSQFLPRQEHATYLGVGVLGEQQIVSFRASSVLPLVLVVETSYRAAVQSWLADARALIGIGVALVALVLGLTFAVWRGLRARERARVAIDAAQARIARNERDLSVLMRSVQELIFRTDAQGVVTYVNAHWTVMTGTPPDRAIGKRIHDLVEPQSRLDVERAIDPRSSDGVRAFQVLCRSLEGKDMIVQVAVVPLVSAGRVIGFAGSAVDETERWMAQQQLQAQIAFQDLLLETNPLPISVTDAQDRFVRVNKAWEEYKGR